MWPLEVGNKFEYAYTNRTDGGKTFKGRYKCKVMKEKLVSVPAGDFDTLLVRCDTKNLRRLYHVSPDLGISIKYEGYLFRGTSRTTSELISFTPGG